MIEVEYLYIGKNGNITRHCAYFHNPDKAVRFMYKCNRSKNLVYSGNFTCTSPFDTEYINRHFK